MRRILTVLSVLTLSALVLFGQQDNFAEDWEDSFAGGFYSEPRDTTFIANWNFNTGMPGDVTEVGDVAVVDGVLEVTIDDGGGDNIYQSISDANELYASWNFTLNSGHSGWDNDEYSRGSGFLNSTGGLRNLFVGVKDDNGTKEWYIQYRSDITSFTGEVGTLSLDTEYLVRIYLKRSSGSDDGQVFVWVDGDSLYAVSDIDNDGIEVNRFIIGNQFAGEFDAELIYDNVKVWRREGLP